MHLAISAHI